MQEALNFKEENISILVADLSGYTALTERHGAQGAAEMIDTYLYIVKESLAGDCYLHEHTGDEVMIVSSSAQQLLVTAQNLVEASSRKTNFLQVHGGLHYGKILKHNNRFFGTTVNLASRIAATANAGTIWCSEDYINALGDKNGLNFMPKGKYSFKNITEKSDVYELIPGNRERSQVDPVCRMLVNKNTNAIPHPVDKHLFFCDEACLGIYLENNAN